MRRYSSNGHVGSKLVTAGANIQVATLRSTPEAVMHNWPPAPEVMTVAVWPDYSPGEPDAPTREDLDLCGVSILIDAQKVPMPAAFPVGTAGGTLALPALGIRRTITAQEITVVAQMAAAYEGAGIKVRSHIAFGHEAGESMVSGWGMGTEEGLVLYNAPRFTTRFRVWDVSSAALLSFYDLSLVSGADMPQSQPAGQFTQWTPWPAAAAGIAALQTSSDCVAIEWGRG